MEPSGLGTLPAQFAVTDGTIVYESPVVIAVANGHFQERDVPAVIGGVHFPTSTSRWGIGREYNSFDAFPALVSEVADHLSFRIEPSADESSFVVVTGDKFRQNPAKHVDRELFSSRENVITLVTGTVLEAMHQKFSPSS